MDIILSCPEANGVGALVNAWKIKGIFISLSLSVRICEHRDQKPKQIFFQVAHCSLLTLPRAATSVCSASVAKKIPDT
jgi:hypothetical protein